MRQYQITIKGMSPLSQSREFVVDGNPDLEPRKGESADAHARRTWPAKMHVGPTGHVVIPAAALKQALDAAAKFKGDKIAGRANKTWAALFTGGVQFLADAVTDAVASEVPMQGFRCDTMGNKGDRSSKRVTRYFPMVPAGWTAVARVLVLEDSIEEHTLREYLRVAGLCVGVGRFRPSKGGTNGMFEIVSCVEIENDDAAAAA
jgi:hypothetical protein